MAQPLTLKNIQRTGDAGTKAMTTGADLFDRATKNIVSAGEGYQEEVAETATANSAAKLAAFDQHLQSYTDQGAYEADAAQIEQELSMADLSVEDQAKAHTLMQNQSQAVYDRGRSKQELADKPLFDEIRNRSATMSSDELIAAAEGYDYSQINDNNALRNLYDDMIIDAETREGKTSTRDTRIAIRDANIPTSNPSSSIEQMQATVGGINEMVAGLPANKRAGVFETAFAEQGITKTDILRAVTSQGGAKDRSALNKTLQDNFGGLFAPGELTDFISKTESDTGADKVKAAERKKIAAADKITQAAEMSRAMKNVEKEFDTGIADRAKVFVEGILDEDGWDVFGTTDREDALSAFAQGLKDGLSEQEINQLFYAKGNSSLFGNFDIENFSADLAQAAKTKRIKGISDPDDPTTASLPEIEELMKATRNSNSPDAVANMRRLNVLQDRMRKLDK